MDTIKDKSILLVDDEPAILLMCQSILKENGFTNILTSRRRFSMAADCRLLLYHSRIPSMPL